MIYTPPDYRQLWEDQNVLINRLHNEKMVLYESLRDRFAMAIISGIMGNIDTNANDCDAVAAVAYEFADAMISVRGNK